MDSHDTVHIAVLPPKAIDADNTRRVASIVDKDIFGTRLLLAGKVPKIVGHYDTELAAQSTLLNLRDLGLAAITCKDSELRQSPHIFAAHTVQFREKEITFQDKSGRHLRMESDDAFLIFAGKVETPVDTTVTRTRMKLNLPATLLTGGLPIRRKVTEETTETSIQAERFVRVYDKKSSAPVVEIRQSEFDYSCLGSKIAPSSSANLSTLTTRIRGAFPWAAFDDRMTGNYGVVLPSTTPWQNVDILCKLIYLFRRSSVSLD